jgi:hypothetical protein
MQNSQIERNKALPESILIFKRVKRAVLLREPGVVANYRI